MLYFDFCPLWNSAIGAPQGIRPKTSLVLKLPIRFIVNRISCRYVVNALRKLNEKFVNLWLQSTTDLLALQFPMLSLSIRNL